MVSEIAIATKAEMEIWEWLREVPDPEIPVLSIIDLGIVRGVECESENGKSAKITITPTYSGCPAMTVIEEEIRAAMEKHGVENLVLKTVLSPAWTTDWMSGEAKERLRTYGVAPPSKLVTIARLETRDSHESGDSLECPRCGSTVVEVISRYGSTACKALYKCKSCLEPFDAFKSH